VGVEAALPWLACFHAVNCEKKRQMPPLVLEETEEMRLRVSSLSELDALVGTHLTNEKPRTHWEDSRTHCQFATLDEALETMHDLFFRELVLPGATKPAVLTEIREFAPYSRDLNLAWQVIEQLKVVSDGAVTIRRQRGESWSVALGGGEPVEAASVAAALCLAALRTKGICVVFDEGGSERDAAAGPGVQVVLPDLIIRRPKLF